MHKTCFKCGLEKALTEFYRHPMMADGVLGKCKDCTKADVSMNYQTNVDRYVAYERERSQRPARKAAVREYRKTRPVVKRRASNLTSAAIRDGRLIPQPCEMCGETTVEAHHDDYNKPLEVRWLCRPHHLEHHGKVSRVPIRQPQHVKR